jgi:hypothetical protein
VKLPDITHDDLDLSWQCVDVAYRNQSQRLQYCADGDGMIVVKSCPEGFKLFDQSEFVRNLGSDLIDALRQAELFMLTHGYKAMHQSLKIWRQTA